MASENPPIKGMQPLVLTWDNEIESDTNIIILDNLIHVIAYVKQNQCDESLIEQILNQVQQHIHLDDAYDFIIASSLIGVFNSSDLDNEGNMRQIARNILGGFVDVLEQAYSQLFINGEECGNEVIEIDTSGLELGMVVKNYKEMCKILNEQICDGNSKKAQLKEWERYFLWEKKGQKFIILDIYDEILPKKDGRENKNIYVQYIEVILMKILSKQKNDNGIFYITVNQLWKLLGMINNNYKNISVDKLNNKISDYNVTSFDVNKFYQRCNQKLREILFSSLNKLQNRALIKYEIEIVIVSTDTKGKLIYEAANDVQKKRILKAERKALLDMGLESKRHVYAKFKEAEFYDRLNAYLYEWYGWDYVYNRIKFIYNKKDILDTVYADEAKLKNEYDKVKLQRISLNDKIMDALYKNAQVMVENRHKKAEEEYQVALEKYKTEELWIGTIPDCFLPTKRDFNIFDYSPYFIEIQNRLTNELISLKETKNEKIYIEFNDADEKELDELFKNWTSSTTI